MSNAKEITNFRHSQPASDKPSSYDIANWRKLQQHGSICENQKMGIIRQDWGGTNASGVAAGTKND